MAKNNYYGKRLTDNNIHQYLKEVYGSGQVIRRRKILNIPELFQSDYGAINDCTLTSMTSCLSYLLKINDYNKIYNVIQSIANNNNYYNEKNGTNPLKIKKIYDTAYFRLSGEKRNSKSGYFKNVCVTEDVIRNIFNNNLPIILNFVNDGRNYYHNHSVTVIGYIDYKYNNGNVMALMVYDNWFKNVAYIDFKKLSLICSINY